MWLFQVESARFFCKPHQDGSPAGDDRGPLGALPCGQAAGIERALLAARQAEAPLGPCHARQREPRVPGRDGAEAAAELVLTELEGEAVDAGSRELCGLVVRAVPVLN